MLTLRASRDRGLAEFGWLSSRHSFSFGHYYDPRFTGYSDLLVINDDVVAPSQGFGTHGHRDMEIISYVLEGQLEHKDSMGTGSVIRPGDVQRMSAGRGVQHSEYNASSSEPVNFLQIWIQPAVKGIAPGYEQIRVADEEKRGQLRLIASPDGAQGSVTLHQDARLYASLLAAGETLSAVLPAGRRAYLHLARGGMRVNEQTLESGDALFIENEATLEIAASENSEFLLFDLR